MHTRTKQVHQTYKYATYQIKQNKKQNKLFTCPRTPENLINCSNSPLCSKLVRQRLQ